jgi:hypothetical protein
MYGVTNPYGFAQVADYTLTSGRAWPGFPISGSVAVGAASTLSFPIQVPVPDTVSSGVNPLTLHVTLRSALHAASCSHDLYDATTPALLSLVDAVAEPTLVRLTWYAAHAGGAAMVYRRTSSEAWSARDQVPPDGAGLIVYEDREVAPGARYGYRLGLMDQGREVFAGETWVDVPLRPAFALAGVRPNPAGGDLTVSLSLPDASPARLEAFDLAGRRIVARDVGSLGGGSHVVRLAEARALAPGFYLLRLTRGDRALTTRVAIVR